MAALKETAPRPPEQSPRTAATTAVRQTRTRRRSEERRRAILAAAVQLFNEKGLRGTTLSDVGQAVGLSTNSICYYFRKKEDLAAACFIETISVIRAIVAEAGRETSSEARIRGLASGFARQLAREAEGGAQKLAGVYDLRALEGTQSKVVSSAYNDLFREVRALLLTADHPKPSRLINARAHLLISLVHSMRIWIGRYATNDYDLVAQHFCDVLIGGFIAPKASWPPVALAPVNWSFEEDATSSRDAFLRAATQTINDLGFSGASVDRISMRLQVTKGAFYHYNESKEGLFSECAARTFAILSDVQNEARSQSTGWNELGSAITYLVAYQLSERGPLLRATALSALPATDRAHMIDATNKLSERFVYPIVRGIADGSIRPVHPVVGSHLVSAMIYATTELPLWVRETHSDEAIELYAKPLLTGFLSELA
ncbi:TetR/AcrR family transcriptional regulator [Microvirga pudoricolor]|uniref:TetR/AcrR family transcriptional regulator n=1 Tax=Microvirga pudoricolor TaxID=2778729 RepID=UPI0019511A64|nr:TetR/AcrR family transcriptional regulator [Microvirga pudoricolor]MBM6593111.1 TetR/AcrR family transcriptional regulator [Microvirga pudoricolor]